MTDPTTIAGPSAPPAYAARPIDPLLIIPVRFLPPVLQTAQETFAVLSGMARDIADDVAGEPAGRMALLDGMAALIIGQKPVIPMDLAITRAAEDFSQAMIDCGGDPLHVTHVLQACRQDVTKQRYRDWNELLIYFRFAAAPYARFCLEALDEKVALAQAEALCCALALLITLRDCANDYRRFDRVYLPERWFKDAGIEVDVLAGERSDGGMRQVITHALDTVERLLVTARPLPRLIGNRYARGAAAASLVAAEKAARRLRLGDPLAGPILPTLGDNQTALWLGRWRKLRR